MEDLEKVQAANELRTNMLELEELERFHRNRHKVLSECASAENLELAHIEIAKAKVLARLAELGG